MEEAANFLEGLEDKSREKVLFNMWKTKASNDKELFKKLAGETWEFRTLYRKTYILFLAFGISLIEGTLLLFQHMDLLRKPGKCPNQKLKEQND